MDLLDAELVERRAGVGLHGILGILFIRDFCIFMMRELGFLVRCMVVMIQDALERSINGEVARVFDVIPFDINSGKIGVFPTLGDGVM